MRFLLSTLALAVVLGSANASGVPVFEWLGTKSSRHVPTTARVAAASTAHRMERKEVSFVEDGRCPYNTYANIPPTSGARRVFVAAYLQSFLTCGQHYSQHRTAGDRTFSPGANKLGSAGVCVIGGETTYPTADPMLSTGIASVTCDISSADKCGHPSCSGLNAAGSGTIYGIGRAIAFKASSGINYECADGGVLPRVSSPRGAHGPADAREPTTAPTPDAGNTQRRQLRYNSYEADDVDITGLVCVGPAVAFVGSLAVTPQDDHMPYKVVKATYTAFNDDYNYAPATPQIDCTMTLAEVEAKYGSNLPIIEPGKWTFTFEQPAREY